MKVACSRETMSSDSDDECGCSSIMKMEKDHFFVFFEGTMLHSTKGCVCVLNKQIRNKNSVS